MGWAGAVDLAGGHKKAFAQASQGVTEKYSKIVGMDIIEQIKAVK